MSATYDCECDNFEMMEDQDAFSMNEGIPGPGVPAGGSAGQILQKRSQEDYDTEWVTPDGYVPAGGSAGQILKKSSAEDYDTEWDSLDAGDVSFDSSLTYEAGTVGEELSSQRNTLNHKADVIYDTSSGSIASFPDGADGLPVKDLTVAIEPVQSGTGDPSPDNVRPISGWTGANVTRTGKNLLNKNDVKTGYLIAYNTGEEEFISSAVCCTRYIPVVAGTSYHFSNCGFYNNNTGAFYDADKHLISSFRQTYTATAPTGAKYIRLSVLTANLDNAQLEIGTEETSYESFGTLIPISWQSSAGTVYGGTLDVTSGVLTVTNGYVDLGTLTWERMTDRAYPVFRPTDVIENMKPYPTGTPDMICSRYPCMVVEFYNYFGDDDNDNKLAYIRAGGQANKIAVQDLAYTDAATFKTAMSGVQLVYELATPQTYQLTPEEVTTLLGQNNIWADCGPSTVEYPCDTKLYIQKINTPTDDDMIADSNIASGQYFIVNNNLYLSTAAILSGDPIKPGTNCTLTNLAAALNALNS